MNVILVSRWNTIYENKRSRELQKLRAVQITNSWESERYHELLGERQAAQIFAAWTLMLQVASTCTPRGALLRDNGKPHDAQSLAIKTHAPAAWFRAAIPYLLANGTHHEPGWLTQVEVATVAELGRHGCFFPPSIGTHLPISAPETGGAVGPTPPKKPAENRHQPAEKGPSSVVLDSVVLNSPPPSSGESEGGRRDAPAHAGALVPARGEDDGERIEAFIARESARTLPPALEVIRPHWAKWVSHLARRNAPKLPTLEMLDQHVAILVRLGGAMGQRAIYHSIGRGWAEPQLPPEPRQAGRIGHAPPDLDTLTEAQRQRRQGWSSRAATSTEAVA